MALVESAGFFNIHRGLIADTKSPEPEENPLHLLVELHCLDFFSHLFTGYSTISGN